MTPPLDATAPPVDLLRLLVLVRARRVLRLASRLALLGLPTWFVVVLAAIIATDDGSATHVWFEDHAARGFVVLAVLLVVAVVGMVGMVGMVGLVFAAGGRRADTAGATAAQLVPMARAVPDPVVAPPSAPGAGRLLDVGSRNRRVPAPGISRWPTVLLGLALVFLIPFCAGTAVDVGLEYRASHGQGGPIVTVTAGSTNVRVDDQDSDDLSYYLTLPRGEALTDARRLPEPGTRFVLVGKSDGLRGIRVGGSSWLEDLIAVVVMVLIGFGVLFFLVRRLCARVPDERIVPLASTLGELARRRTVTVQAVPRRGRPSAAPVVLASARNDDADPTSCGRRAVRRVTAGVIALLVVAGLVTALV